jgi:hypothetical protein
MSSGRASERESERKRKAKGGDGLLGSEDSEER